MLLVYAIIAGLTIHVPDLPVLHQSIRTLFYHVGMWFAMFVMFAVSIVCSIRYLYKFNPDYDRVAREAANVGILFGMLGIITGMVWARFTWGTWWINDTKLNGAAISLMAYFAYLLLRSSVENDEKRAKIAAVYNIFSFVLLVIFIIILPKMSEASLHPGNKGNSLTVTAMDDDLRCVFYPAIIGWILLAFWLLEIKVRINKLIEN